MVNYLVDANVWSEATKQQPAEKIVEWLNKHFAETCTCSIVWHELQKGVKLLAPGRKQKMLSENFQRLLDRGLEILPYDQAAAEWHAEELARLQSIGRVAPHSDSQIAAIAAVHNLTVVSINRKDFANFKGLKIKSW